MKAIILAAGRGSRMGSLTEEQPKCLVNVCGKSLLYWQLSAFKKANIREIAIVTGYKHELLSGYGLKEFYNSRWAETNMVSSLACAEAWLQETPCIVSYSDIFFEASAISLLQSCSAELAVTFDSNWLELWKKRFGDPLLDAETFKLLPDSTLAEIGNTPTSLEDVQGQYMGLLKFTPASWNYLRNLRLKLPGKMQDSMHMTASLNAMIQAGYKIQAVPYSGVWGEIDSPSDLNLYRCALPNQSLPGFKNV